MKQVPIFISWTVVCFYITFRIGNGVDTRWRRAEIIISGFKDSAKTGYGSPRYIEVRPNNQESFVEKIKSIPDDNNLDEDFIFHAAIYDYQDSMKFPNYFLPIESRLKTSIFEDPLSFKITAMFSNGLANQTFLSVTTTEDFRCAANADRYQAGIRLSSTVKMDIYVSYRCHGYHGLGCRFLCDVGNDVPYECLYDTNEQVCKDSRFNNPPICNQNITTCNVNPCSINGKCIYVSNLISYCVCNPGYRGDKCQNTYCQQICDPDFGNCTGPNTCTCAPGYSGLLCDKATCNFASNPCANQGTCAIVANEIVCECDPSLYAGKLCALKCNPQCVFGKCLDNRGHAQCQCFDGFIGETCNATIPEPEPIYEPGYLSKRSQILIYFGLTAALIILSIGVLGVATYQRAHKKRVLRVVRSAEKSARTIQINSEINENFDNSLMKTDQ